MLALAFAFLIDALPLYALRSKEKPIFPSHVRNVQSHDLELTQIFSLSIKKFSLSMLIQIARLRKIYRYKISYRTFDRLEAILCQTFRRQPSF